GLEKDLQPELHPSRRIALAAGTSKVGVAVIRLPGLIDRAEENAVEDVAGISLEPNVAAFAEVSVLEDGEVLVEVLKATDACILAGSVTESKQARVSPSSLAEISARGF